MTEKNLEHDLQDLAKTLIVCLQDDASTLNSYSCNMVDDFEKELNIKIDNISVLPSAISNELKIFFKVGTKEYGFKIKIEDL